MKRNYSRIVTHTDMDGIISAMLLSVVFKIDKFKFIEPAEIQHKNFVPDKTDIVCDLPRSGGLWFDHHPIDEKNKTEVYESHWDEKAPSAARIIFETYKDQLQEYEELVIETDKIDSADFTKEELKNPTTTQKLSITIRPLKPTRSHQYKIYLIRQLSYLSPEEIMKEDMVLKRYEEKIEAWKKGEGFLKQHIVKDGTIRILDTVPFIEKNIAWRMYSFYLEKEIVDYVISTRYVRHNNMVKVNVGANLFDKEKNKIHLGKIMQKYGGNGHHGIGGCSTTLEKYKEVVKSIREDIKKGM